MPTFDNLHKRAYYRDNKKLEKILSLEKEGQFVKLYPILHKYVDNFGIRNFYRDTRLLWLLAKITEEYGNPENAKLLYSMVLRHHRKGDPIMKLVPKDQLSQDKASDYIPLDYYYELVEYRQYIDTLRPPVGVRQNMGHLINSDKSDYAPFLRPDNERLIFTSKRMETNDGIRVTRHENIYFSDSDDGDWSEANLLPGVNSRNNEGSVCISADGTRLYFARCDAPDCYGNCDIFEATLDERGQWGNVKNLGINVNSNAWDSHPSLSPSGDTLYYASDRLGGFGLSDIYFTTRKKDGTWTPAKNCGPVINTRGNDVSPFFHPARNVLYFSSDGHPLNFGAQDIYKSHKIGTSNWSDPLNIGPLVNSEQSEFYFTIDGTFNRIFYAKSIENKLSNLDLYSFPLPMEAHPDANTSLTGSLVDAEDDEPFTGIVSVIDLEQGIEVAPKFLNKDGEFQFNLIDKRKYLLVIQGDDFFRIEKVIFLDGDTDISENTSAISRKLKFESIRFENGKSDILPAMYADLNKVANFMLDHPNFKLKISGHTDSSGDEEFNKELSQKRADAIMNYISFIKDVPEQRIEAIGHGSSKPISKTDMSLNRRVEFEIYRPSEEELKKLREQIDNAPEDQLDDW
ncbi:OmpA family protein [Fulvitalea axinellae]